MARYIATSGSYFEPFTYEQLAAPVQQATEAVNTTADAYDQMNLEASALEEYLQREPNDSRAREMYNTYMKQLNSLQDELWNNGYSAAARRNLTAARKGYASNIVRLQKAITDRQERSKEYWDTVHKNPDMVMGFDPGAANLDKYLENDLYGHDYYSYNGQDLMNSVGVDAKARVSELLRNPKYQNDVPGYITRFVTNGATSEEVEKAKLLTDAVLAGTVSRESLEGNDSIEAILASTLLSHLDATGATTGENGNISQEQFNRLVNYGKKGLSQAIGKTEQKDLEDKVWELQAQRDLENYKASLKAGTNAAANRGYVLNDISAYSSSSNASEEAKFLDDNFIAPFKDPIITHDGKEINNPADAALILRQFGGENFANVWGADPSDPVGEGKYNNGVSAQKIKIEELEQSDFDVKATTSPYIVKVRNNKDRWVVSDALTEKFNKDITEYRGRLDEWKKNNPNIDLEKLAISVNDRKKMKEAFNIPEEVPEQYIPYILQTMMSSGRKTPATIADAQMGKAREAYADNLIAAYALAPKTKKGKVPKTDESAIFEVDENGVISQEGKQSLGDVLGVKSEGKSLVTSNKTIEQIYMFPEDLEINRVRFTVGGKQYAVNPAMFGNLLDYQISKLKEPVKDLMLPLTNPVEAMMMPGYIEEAWSKRAQEYIGNYMRMTLPGSDGQSDWIRPRDIVENPDLRDELRRAVTQYMNDVIAGARDTMMLQNEQVRGDNSDKAVGYNDFYFAD